jgi:chaperonin GroES
LFVFVAFVASARPMMRMAVGNWVRSLIIPDAHPPLAVSLAIVVGSGRLKSELEEVSSWRTKVGNSVLFGTWSGTEIKIDGEELLIMNANDIMGVLTDVLGSKNKAA